LSDGPSKEPNPWAERLSTYKERLLQVAVLGIPTIILSKLNDELSGRILEQPWQALWFLVPIGIAVWVLRQSLAGRREFRIDRRMLIFLGAYVLLFSLASQMSFLDWSRKLTVFGREGERSWLTPVSWGDWRYRILPKKRDSDELVLVLLEPGAGKSREVARKELVDLIAIAAGNGVRGVALDFYFEGESAMDRLLCAVIERSGIPVFAGFGFERFGGRIAELPMPDSLRPCFPAEHTGHLAGFIDADEVARLTPLFFLNDETRPALSLLVARALSGGAALRLPNDGLLRFVEPLAAYEPLRLAELEGSETARNLLRNRFLLVGEESDRDSFKTPFGRKPGVMVHADVVHSLRQAHFVEKPPWWLGLGFILVFCFWIAVRFDNGASAARLALICLAATACLVAVAVTGLFVGPYWFDVVYPVTAVWILLPLLLGVRRTITDSERRRSAESGP
jgi:CHASE2 domain-containing sensor protein